MLEPQKQILGASTVANTIIDRRPAFIILLEQSRKPGALLMALFFLSLPWLVDGPTTLPVPAWRVMGVFLACTTLWITQAIPLGATGLLAFATLPVYSGIAADKVFSYFGNKAVFFLIGAFLLAAGVRASGLSVRVALVLFRRFGTSARSMVTVIMCSGFAMSIVMPEHAVAAILYPIIVEVLDAMGGDSEETKLYAPRLYLAMVWGVVIGGVVTFLGGARIPLAIGILEESTHMSIGFVEWMKFSVPVAVPTFIVALGLVRFGYRWWPESIEHAQNVLRRKQQLLGPPSKQEIKTAVIVLLTLFCWLFLGERLGLATIGLMGVLLLLLTRSVEFAQMQKGVDWSVIFLYGGAIAMGQIMIDTGAALWIADSVIPTSLPLIWQLLFIAAIVVFFTELVSNAAVVALMLPVVIGKLSAEGVDPRLITVSVALMSGFVFNLPIGTPAMSMAFGSGYLSVKQTTKRGIILTFSALLFFALALRFVY